MKPAIRVENLSKSYRISHASSGRERYKTLRESVLGAIKAPFERWTSNGNGQARAEDFWALKDVSFEVQPGEVIGIIGRNGAGKSTLLKILSRITKPTGGHVSLHGRVGSLLEVGTGFHQELTGRENIFLNGAILGMRRREIQNQFDAIVDFSGVEKFLDTPVKRYSSGMYVRLAFAVAAHLNPEILIVDEVLSVGDSEFQKRCMGKMKDVSAGGRTVLLVSHNLAAIENLCSAVILLRQGRLEHRGEVRATLNMYMKEFAVRGEQYDPATAHRTGTGHLRFTSFHIEDGAGARVDTIQSGQKVCLVFGYETLSGGTERHVNVGFGLHPSSGERLAVFYASDADQEFDVVPAKGEFRCVVPRLDFAPTRLYVYPRIEVAGVEAEFPRNGVGSFDVEAGDFFGSGKMIGMRGNAPFLINGKWVVTCP